MTKWEYASLWLNMYGKDTIKKLNEWGDAGWEIIAVVPGSETHIFYFKRPKP